MRARRNNESRRHSPSESGANESRDRARDVRVVIQFARCRRASPTARRHLGAIRAKALAVSRPDADWQQLSGWTVLRFGALRGLAKLRNVSTTNSLKWASPTAATARSFNS